MQTAEQILQASKLLQELIATREQELIQKWRGSFNQDNREQAWFGLMELQILAGAIEDGIRKHSTDGQ